MNKIKHKILILKIKYNKDSNAFGQIYDLFVDKIYRFIYFKVSRREEAEDITSEVFLRAWEYLTNKEKEVENLNSFLYQIAKNLVIDHYRKQNKKTVSLEEIAEVGDNNKEENIVMDKIDQGFKLEKIEEALKFLKDEYREVVIMKFLENYKTGEIAQILNKTSGNVRILLHRAIKALTEIVSGQKK